MPFIPQLRLNRRRYNRTADWRKYRVTPHFTLGEFFTHQHDPPSWEWMNMVRGCAITILEPLRARYGPCVVLSGYRDPATNRAVGGAQDSWHVWEWHPGEMGVDVMFQRGTPPLWAEAASRGPAGGIGTYARHLHLDTRPERVSWVSPAP